MMPNISTTVFLIIVLLGMLQTLCAQELPIYDNNANRIDIYHFQKYLENNEVDKEQNSIGSLPTAVFRYQGDTLNTRHLNQANFDPELIEEQNIVLTMPEMPLAQDTLLVMVAVPDQDAYRVNVFVVENQGAQLVYHFDRNNDYSFLEEGPPFIFSKNKQIEALQIQAVGDPEPLTYYVYDFAMMPAFLARYGINVKEVSYVNSFYYPMLNRHGRISLQVHANFGKGNHQIIYDTPALSREISASLDAITQWGISLSYALYNLNIGGFFFMEGNQIGQTERYNYEGGVRTIDYGFGNWPRRRMLYGAEIAYDFRVYKNIYLAPFYRYGTYRFSRDETFSQQIGSGLDQTLTYQGIFQKTRLHSFGAQMKFPLGEKALLLVEGSYLKNRYRLHPDFILEDVENGSLSTDYQALTFGVGVQWILCGQ
ncbi:MAG: hypothetical protein RIG62_05780 [Cyclobacteriaceae bacterium]